jgi:hypothetical protein
MTFHLALRNSKRCFYYTNFSSSQVEFHLILKTDTDIKIEQLHGKVRSLLSQGLNEIEITRTLEKEGIDPGYAGLIIDNIKTDERDRKDFWKLIIMGLFFVIGGLTINYLSYTIAVNINATFYFIYWGVVAMGIIFLVRAFALYRKGLFKR